MGLFFFLTCLLYQKLPIHGEIDDLALTEDLVQIPAPT